MNKLSLSQLLFALFTRVPIIFVIVTLQTITTLIQKSLNKIETFVDKKFNLSNFKNFINTNFRKNKNV